MFWSTPDKVGQLLAARQKAVKGLYDIVEGLNSINDQIDDVVGDLLDREQSYADLIKLTEANRGSLVEEQKRNEATVKKLEDILG